MALIQFYSLSSVVSARLRVQYSMFHVVFIPFMSRVVCGDKKLSGRDRVFIEGEG